MSEQFMQAELLDGMTKMRSTLPSKRITEFSFATSIPGMIKNAEGQIGERITYARVTIRKIKEVKDENQVT
jgi:hypothetical protein